VIRRVHIENFRCLRDVTLDLEPLTVLVGPNASGKSAILGAFDPRVPWHLTNQWRHDANAPIKVSFDLADGQSRDVSASHGQHRPYEYQLLQLDIQQLRQPNRLERAERLNLDGSNLANVFATLTRKEQAALSQHFCELVPMFMDVDVVPHENGTLWLRFQDRWSPDIWYRPHEVSDGTLLVVAFLALQYQIAPVDLVAIEEPERGLHPYLIGELIKLLRNMATGKVGPRPIQFLLATHSAELLEFVRPEEVLFLDRIPADGSVRATRIDTTSADWQQSFREYAESLGSAWLAGGLGGVPGAGRAEAAE
jgi:predicted ATPase